MTDHDTHPRRSIPPPPPADGTTAGGSGRGRGGTSRRRFALGMAGAALGTVGASGALAGCGAPGGGGSGRPGDPIELTVLTHYGTEPLKSGFEALLDEWNATHDRVKVRPVVVKFPDLLTTSMVRQTAGQGADIIHPYALWAGQLAQAEVLQPVPKDLAADIRREFTQPAVDAASVDGTLYGYPTEMQTYALYYNRRLLREAGVERAPRTWPELERAAYTAARRDRHGNALVQGFGLSTIEDATVVGQTLALLAARGESFLSPDGSRSTIDSPAARAVLDLEVQMIERGAADPGINLRAAFPSGQVAMCIDAGWWTGSLKAAMGEDYRDVGVLPVPPLDPQRPGTIATAFLMGVNADSRHPEEAWEFLRWLNSERTSVPLPAPDEESAEEKRVTATRMGAFQTSVGSMTGRTDDMRALLDEDGDPNVTPFLSALEYALPEPNGPHAQQVKSTLRKNLESAWSGQRSATGALRTAHRQIEQLLRRD